MRRRKGEEIGWVKRKPNAACFFWLHPQILLSLHLWNL
jgi:hypothetical protein